MAKENIILLEGLLQKSPKITVSRKDGTKKAQFVIQTLRRNNKYDFPIIDVLDEKLIEEEVSNFKVGDFIKVKGILATDEVKKGVICEHCQGKIMQEGTTTSVIAIDTYTMGPNFKLERLKEFSNTVFILGSLCRDPEFRLLPNTGIASCQFQLAVNRKYHVKKQSNDNRTDYPWVNSFGKQAEQDAIRLGTSSQVYVQGGLQTRSVQKTIECPHCHKSFKAEDFVAEIVPYSVEYLNNCKFE